LVVPVLALSAQFIAATWDLLNSVPAATRSGLTLRAKHRKLTCRTA